MTESGSPSGRISLDGPERRVHIVGIGGAGMRAIARVLIAMGHHVTGSDRADSEHIESLLAVGARAVVGHAPGLAANAEFVTRSTAVPDTDPDVVAATAAGVPVLSRASVLAAISRACPAVLVAGTHGKTTTSSMLAAILDEAGLVPGFVIGSDVARFGSGARWGGRDIQVIEADESDGTFLELTGAHAIVTSLDPDHLDHYGSRAALNEAFVRFVEAIPGVTAVCVDDPDTGVLLDVDNVVTYGTAEGADLRLTDITDGRSDISGQVWWRGRRLGRAVVALPGRHNLLNAAGASAIALSLGVGWESIASALVSFGGVARRFEVRGEERGVTFVDDYAHLPAEVEAAVAAARAGGWRRVVAAYQPHRFSRTAQLGATFAGSFRGVDHLVLTDIYPSGESPIDGVTGRIVLEAVCRTCPDLSVVWRPSLDDVVDHLADELVEGDLCLTLGAGDLTTVPDRIAAALGERSTTRVRDRVRALASADDSVDLDRPLGEFTTYRVGGSAAGLVEVMDSDRLRSLLATTEAHRVPVLVIGRGSNLLISDAGFDGLAMTLAGDFESIAIEGTTVTAGAAVPLPSLARQTVAAGLTGFEWAVGVPGSIGGAVAMNAGGHGSDLASSLVGARVLDRRTGDIEVWKPDRLRFRYRGSDISTNHVVIDATLALEAGEPTQGEAALQSIVRWRRDNQPGGQNAGSVFTNPIGDSAGRLLDEAGAKGLRRGSAEVSGKHANFIQVDPRGSADDVFSLMREMAALVERRFGVELVPETRLIGFDQFRPSTRDRR